jgi:hypothetical protein
MVYKNCLDVILADKPYYIRFTDELNEGYWATILDKRNFSKKITVKFQARFLNGTILYNPNEVLIDNQIIIPANSKKSFIGWMILFFIVMIGVCVYNLRSFLGTYKAAGLYLEDSKTKKESLWKLVMIWVND